MRSARVVLSFNTKGHGFHGCQKAHKIRTVGRTLLEDPLTASNSLAPGSGPHPQSESQPEIVPDAIDDDTTPDQKRKKRTAGSSPAKNTTNNWPMQGSFCCLFSKTATYRVWEYNDFDWGTGRGYSWASLSIHFSSRNPSIDRRDGLRLFLQQSSCTLLTY